MIINLGPEQERRLRELARACGKPPEEVLGELVSRALSAAGREANGIALEAKEKESFFDAAKRAGVIGIVRGGPSDLSTNPDHMEGFGESE